MKYFSTLLPLLASTSITLALAAEVEPSIFIVKLKSDPAAKRSSELHDQFYTALSSDEIDYSSRYNYTLPDFHAASISVNGLQNPLEYLKSLSIVTDAWVSGVIKVVAPGVKEDVQNAAQKPLPARAKRSVDSELVISNSVSCPADLSSSNPWGAIHKYTHVDDVHSAGIYGDDVVVAILDTGVDYNHPALGGGLGNKVIGGKSYSGDSFLDTNGHGTHAAGIATGNCSKYIGVAPNAKVLAYLLDPDLSAFSVDLVIAAMNQAYEDGADIINLSLGSADGFVGGPMDAVYTSLADNGVIIVGSWGNHGNTNGVYDATSIGGPNKRSLGVASYESPVLATWPFIVKSPSGEAKKLNYLSFSGYFLDFDGYFSADYSSESSCDIKTRPGNSEFLIAPRGGCTHAERFTNLKNLGYKYYFVINGPDDLFLFTSVALNYPTVKGAFIDYSYSEWFESQAEKNSTFTLFFDSAASPLEIPSVYYAASYPDTESSFGLTYDNYFSPSITAPGGSIFVPDLDNNYIYVSGNSFSAPYMSGVAALYLSSIGVSRSKGNSNSEHVANFVRRAVTTGQDLGYYDVGVEPNPNISAPLIKQGGGLVDASKLVNYQIQITSDPYISLNDTANRENNHEITFINNGVDTITYSVKHSPGTGVQAFDSDGFTSVTPPPITSDEATVEFSTTEGELGPGESASIQVEFSLPDVKGTILAGKIEIETSGGEIVGVPYAGVQYNLKKDVKLLQNFSFGVYDSTSGDISSVTKPVSLSTDFYGIIYYIHFGIRQLEVYLTTPQFQLDSNSTSQILGPAVETDEQGESNDYPVMFVEPSPLDPYLYHSGKFTNGTKFTPGKYKFYARALRPFGDVNNAQDWLTYLTDEFEFVA